ncbi:type II toxin-antitoxin system RelE/ParE family toxin [Klebsiella quasipneumoniae]|uniref:type II toxin-antitoxin system RelE family toxin n=1 Tax=Klebsiella quasipneumoniae TaxID=1463165 RepID=UPI0002C4174F|nr:type II toxin-antitoxin system RelE/ParE family toxin [Klebsiella quasipneumoniae]AMR14131.1 addiction module toxin RelE [Klebsiella quasipneumoniae]AVF87500.1 type II toxin-antitoxin system RelE/ParE family toxin [Klebsiella quasipneumoniae]AWO60978.1 type II toxin-antitoxin system RelE/ParE family toxin [Klebsiella quasipneumoniae subsp. similipneumoniae]EMR16735.1 putative inner membrane protein [Klebsiella quasipneumoniae]MBK5765259.1 type II toxin-antitoxin system RelE/ParE family toxi
MTYELEFDPRAWREWQKLGETVKKQFKNKLQQIVQNPRIESARLSDLPDCDKIKLKASGYRLVYQVRDRVVVVYVIAIGKREKAAVYHQANKRL